MFNTTKQLFNWRSAKKNGKEINRCTRLLVGGMLIFASSPMLLAAPTGGVVVEGASTISLGTNTVINQNTDYTQINWTGFNTAAGESVTFNQARGVNSVAVNKISGARTTFDGTLNANGRVFLINQNGLTFGAGSQVNVGSLLATTSQVGSSNGPSWLDAEGNYLVDAVNPVINFDATGTGANASIVNHGSLTALSSGGFVALVAPYVENNATITARLGEVNLISGGDSTMTVDFRGDGIIAFETNATSGLGNFLGGEGEVAGVKQSATGQIQAREINIAANIAQSVVSNVVNLGGVLDATAIDAHGALINVNATGGVVNNSPLTISATDANQSAHTQAKLVVDGQYIDLDQTTINLVSHADGEGAINVSAQSAGIFTANGVDATGQSVRFNGDLTVDARADNTGFFDGDASASADFSGPGDINITTAAQTIRVNADASGSSANADANLNIAVDILYGGPGTRVGDGDVSLSGHVDIAATADNSDDSGSADANLFMRGQTVTVTDGDIAIAADAKGSSSVEASADAVFFGYDINDNGESIRFQGDLAVDARVRTDYSSTAVADAGVVFAGPGDIKIETASQTISVKSDAFSSGSYAAESKARLDIKANQQISSWSRGSSDGDVSLTGHVEVVATNLTSDDSGYSTTLANADLLMRGVSITVDEGDILVRANADGGNSTDAAANARAKFVAQEQRNGTSIDFNGDLLVDASAIAEDDNATAYASADFSGPGDINITTANSTVAVHSDAQSDRYGSAMSDLQVNSFVGGEGELAGAVNLNGHFEVLSDGSNILEPSRSEIEGHANMEVNGQTVAMNGVVDVKSTATDPVASGRYGTRAEASAYSSFNGQDELIFNGDLIVSATVDGLGSYANANADFSSRGDVNIATADETVRVTAQGIGGDAVGPWGDQSEVSSELTVRAGNDVNFRGSLVSEALTGAPVDARKLVSSRTEISANGDINGVVVNDPSATAQNNPTARVQGQTTIYQTCTDGEACGDVTNGYYRYGRGDRNDTFAQLILDAEGQVNIEKVDVVAPSSFVPSIVNNINNVNEEGAEPLHVADREGDDSSFDNEGEFKPGFGFKFGNDDLPSATEIAQQLAEGGDINELPATAAGGDLSTYCNEFVNGGCTGSGEDDNITQ